MPARHARLVRAYLWESGRDPEFSGRLQVEGRVVGLPVPWEPRLETWWSSSEVASPYCLVMAHKHARLGHDCS
ncbi:Uncharacterized protein HZ326_11856 [Fusarium oxysporum f. sp. albedinis]|nr:Uncharacterized protein HZ326_11856 [Fusarium oxysporum f. sp. albedinis]